MCDDSFVVGDVVQGIIDIMPVDESRSGRRSRRRREEDEEKRFRKGSMLRSIVGRTVRIRRQVRERVYRGQSL